MFLAQMVLRAGRIASANSTLALPPKAQSRRGDYMICAEPSAHACTTSWAFNRILSKPCLITLVATRAALLAFTIAHNTPRKKQWRWRTGQNILWLLLAAAAAKWFRCTAVRDDQKI